jgi:hypothetical protein
LHKAKQLPKECFADETERASHGPQVKPWDTMYFKLYTGQQGRAIGLARDLNVSPFIAQP